MIYFVAFIVGLLVAGIVALNVWYHRHLRRMTPEERARHEEEMRIDMQVW